MALQHKPKVIKLSDYYKPYPAQQRFHESGAVYRLFGGAKGPGKSFALLWEAVRTCRKIAGCNVLIIRRTYPELKKGIMRHFELYVKSEIYGGLKNYNKSENVVTFPNGSKLFFGCAQHEKDILAYNGHEYAAIFIDESTEFTYFQFQFLIAQLRCPQDPTFVPFMAMGTNPIGVGHEWHKALFVGELQPDGTYKRTLATVKKALPGEDIASYDPTEYEYIPATLDDNLTFAQGTKLGDDYRKKLDKLPDFLKDAYIKGSWETNTGRYFSRFDAAEIKLDRHIVNRLVAAQIWHKKWIGIDWGYNDFCTVFWFSTITLKDEEGNERDLTVLHREFIDFQVGEQDLGRKIVELSTHMTTEGEETEHIEAVYLSPDAFAKKGAQNTIAEQIGEALVEGGLPYPQMADDDRVGGARLLDELMSRKRDIDDDPTHAIPMPEFMISDECEQALFALPRLMRDPKKPNDVLKVKREGDPTDDIYDGIRYGLKSKLAGGEVPYAVKRQRLLNACATNQERYILDINLRHTKKASSGIRFGRPRFSRTGARA
jgi:PBSX family phage terminase large subunit